MCLSALAARRCSSKMSSSRSRKLLEGKGAWRVHGGGFAGCVQALMPTDYFPTYKEDMEKAFGGGSCREIRLV